MANIQPLVSIIITSYNHAPFLGQAINSALQQAYPAIELIVIDDGSTDNTAQVMAPFLNRVTYHRQDNAGVVVARNTGLARSTGEYVLFVDADDYLADTAVGMMVSAIANSSAAFVYGDIEYFGAIETTYVAQPWNEQALLLTNYIGLTSLISRSALSQVGGFDLQFNRSADFEDWDLWLSLAAVGLKGLYLPSPVYYHRTVASGSRNMVGRKGKIRQRWRIIQKHWRLYVRLGNLWLLPLLAWRIFWQKLAYKRDQSARD